MQKTQIYQAIVGGAATTNKYTIIATTTIGEQLDIRLTKRTSGKVRMTVGEAATATPTSGVELPLDEPVIFRLGESQRLFIVTDEVADPQSVDVIISPSDVPKPIIDALTNVATTLGYTTPPTTYACPPKKWK